MAKKYKYTLARRAIVWETWTVEADDLDEAEQLVDNGDGTPEGTEFIEYYDDDWQLDNSELLDPFVKMMLEYEPQK